MELYIQKRADGPIEPFDKQKIVVAVQKSVNDLIHEYNKIKHEETRQNLIDTINPEIGNIVAEQVLQEYTEVCEDNVEDVDYINILVEHFLIRNEHIETARHYIAGRQRKEYRRESIKQVYYKSKFLSEEFLNQFGHYPEKMLPIAQFTFLRTYSRDIPELGRRETFKETIIRAVDHNINLDTRPRTVEVMSELISEAQELFRIHFEMKGSLSGRALFTGGSSASQRYPLSLFNCSYLEPRKIADFKDMLYLLSVGAGVGYRVTQDIIGDLPTFRNNVEVEVLPFTPKPKRMRLDDTVITDGGNVVYIDVGDSKEGWATATEAFLNFHTVEYNYEKIYLMFDNVRPEGEPLMTFGGYASGHEPLQNAFLLINEVISGDYKDSHGNVLTKAPVDGRLRPIHVMHISNMIANAIVVGGVRRSAMICLFDRKDEELLNAKTGFADYEDPKITHYWLSNNTMIFEDGYKPTREEIAKVIERIKKYGEPAFMNESQLKVRHPEATGMNPCAEILLKSYQTCNLVTYVLSHHIIDGVLDQADLETTIKLVTRATVRVTLNTLELEHWDKAQKDDRLLGVSPSGYMDAMEILAYNVQSEIDLLQGLYEVVRFEADEYADTLGINRPLNVTAVKPSGTNSLLFNENSPGIHASHSKYYFRTIRVSKNNPIYDVIKLTNWRIEDDVTKPDSTAIVYFPSKSPVKRTKKDITALEQLERYKRFQEHYSDQNTSITVHVTSGEWDTVTDWLDENWDDFTAVSFLALTDHEYKQAPYQDITKEEYEEAIKDMHILDHDFITKHLDLSKLYDAKEEMNDDPDCATGACGLDRL